MEIRQMKYFLAVARQESITKAAELLFITQPSLTRQIQSLEKEIGSPLFVRGKRKLSLTETGKLLRKRAEEMLLLYEKTEAELLSASSAVGGDVFIGGGESYAMGYLASVAKELHEKNPNIHFHLFSGDIADVTERLDKGLLDFGLLIEPADLTKYDFIKLPVKDTWGVLLRRDHPLAKLPHVTAEDLRNTDLIISRHALNRSNVTEWFGGKRMPEACVTYNLLYNAALFAQQGIGAVVCLDKLISLTEDSDLCFRPFFPKLESDLSVAWKKHQVFSKAAQLFLDILKTRVDAEKLF